MHDAEKLAIAVKALQEVERQLIDGMNRHSWDDAYLVASNALKEIQG